MIPRPAHLRALSAIALASALWLPGFAHADEQADRIKALERQLEQSLLMIERLSLRVSELERARPVASAPPALSSPTPVASPWGTVPAAVSAPGPSQDLASLTESVNQISKGLSQRSDDTGLPVHGFADVGGAWSRGADPVRLRGFNIGTLDIYLTPQFGDRVKSLVELAFEYEEDGGGEVDLERLQLGYSVSDALTLWAGRFHTPFGLWNTSYHHGAHLQTSLSRPRFVEFEDKGGIIPAHSVGLWANGKSRLGAGKLTYDTYLTNGPRIRDRHLNFNAFTDDNANKMLGGTIGYELPGTLSGLAVGVHAFGSTVNIYSSAGSALKQTRLRMAGGFFGYDSDDWEAIGEFYRFANTETASGIKRSSNAGFVHVGRAFGTLTPYLRYERASLDPDDSFFASQRVGRSYRRAVVGARQMLDARSSVKFEISDTSEDSAMLLDGLGSLEPFPASRYRRAAFQYSIAF